MKKEKFTINFSDSIFKQITTQLFKELEVEYIDDNGFLSYSPSKSKITLELKIEIIKKGFRIKYFNHTIPSKYKTLDVTGNSIESCVYKMKKKLKSISLIVTKKEWDVAIKFAIADEF